MQQEQHETTTAAAAAASEPINTKKIRPFPDRPFRPIAMLPMDHTMTQRYHRHEFVVTEYIPGDVVMVVLREIRPTENEDGICVARWFNEKNEAIAPPLASDNQQECWDWLFHLRHRLTIVGHIKEDEWVGVRGIVFKDKSVASSNNKNKIRFTDAFCTVPTHGWCTPFGRRRWSARKCTCAFRK